MWISPKISARMLKITTIQSPIRTNQNNIEIDSLCSNILFLNYLYGHFELHQSRLFQKKCVQNFWRFWKTHIKLHKRLWSIIWTPYADPCQDLLQFGAFNCLLNHFLLLENCFSGVVRWYDLFSNINVTSGTVVGDFHNDLYSQCWHLKCHICL